MKVSPDNIFDTSDMIRILSKRALDTKANRKLSI